MRLVWLLVRLLLPVHGRSEHSEQGPNRLLLAFCSPGRDPAGLFSDISKFCPGLLGYTESASSTASQPSTLIHLLLTSCPLLKR